MVNFSMEWHSSILRISAEIWTKREDETDIPGSKKIKGAGPEGGDTCIPGVGGGYYTGVGDYGQGQKRSQDTTLSRYGE